MSDYKRIGLNQSPFGLSWSSLKDIFLLPTSISGQGDVVLAKKLSFLLNFSLPMCAHAQRVYNACIDLLYMKGVNVFSPKTLNSADW